MGLERYTPQQDQASLSPSFTVLGSNGKPPAQKSKRSTSNKYVRFRKASHFLCTIALEPLLTAWPFFQVVETCQRQESRLKSCRKQRGRGVIGSRIP